MSSKEISVRAICHFPCTLYVHLSGGKWSTLLLHWPPVKKLTLLVLSRPLVREEACWPIAEVERDERALEAFTESPWRPREAQNFIAPDPVQIVRNETNCPFRTHRTVAIQEALSKLPPPLPRADCILFQHYVPQSTPQSAFTFTTALPLERFGSFPKGLMSNPGGGEDKSVWWRAGWFWDCSFKWPLPPWTKPRSRSYCAAWSSSLARWPHVQTAICELLKTHICVLLCNQQHLASCRMCITFFWVILSFKPQGHGAQALGCSEWYNFLSRVYLEKA